MWLEWIISNRLQSRWLEKSSHRESPALSRWFVGLLVDHRCLDHFFDPGASAGPRLDIPSLPPGAFVLLFMVTSAHGSAALHCVRYFDALFEG